MAVKDTLLKIEKIKDENNYPLTIDELQDKLNQFDENEEVTLTDGNYLDGKSFTGNCDYLRIDGFSKDASRNKVLDLKSMLIDALEIGVMHKQRGGNYPINVNTNVYVTYYTGSDMVVDLVRINGELLLVTKDG